MCYMERLCHTHPCSSFDIVDVAYMRIHLEETGKAIGTEETHHHSLLFNLT